jgi:integrase
MSVYDRWHRRTTRKNNGDQKCSCKPSKWASDDHGCKKRWQVRWRDETGQQRKRNFEKKEGKDPNTCAEAFDVKIRDQLNSGTYINPEDGKVKFRDYAEEWRKNQLHREQTRTLVERSLRLYINPLIGDLPLGAVRPKHIQKVVNECTKKLEPSVVEVVYGYVASIYRAALREPVIGRSPCVGIHLPAKGVKRIRPLDAVTVEMLAEALPSKYRAIPRTAAGTGLRPGETFGLEIDCIDFERKELHVRQQLITSSEQPHIAYLAEPKTPQSNRMVPITQGVIDMISAYLDEFPATEVEVEDRTDPRKPKSRTAELIFTTTQGNPIKRQTWGDIWRPAARTAGLPARTGLHICRHTYASALIRFGESPKTVQVLMGHKNPTITLNTYLHLWPDSDDRARQAIEAMFADVPSMCPRGKAG